jgi:flagellum-specific peptidoglycan hydrolase FlgJ
MTKNPCYTAGKTITVKGLMLHSVGCAQPKASVFINSWNSASYDRACVHGFIDGNDGTVYQTLPWNHRGWHCGGSGNNTHIGVEMCEPACIKYTSGSSFTCSDTTTAQAVAKRTYEAAAELFAMLCKQYGLNPLTDICSHKEGCAKGIASNHGDPEHLWNGLKMSYTMDTFRKAVKAKMNTASETSDASGTQASVFRDLSESDVIAKVGPLFTADQKKNGILASVSLAQFILESGYGKSELAQNANNCFGMKKSLSGNTWSGSAWDGKSTYTKQTQEEENGKTVTVTAEFRKYASVEDSIADHSAYLLGAKNGSALRYIGLNSCTDYKKAAQLIKDGGYATSSSYVSSLCSIIEKWNLTKYDVVDSASTSSTASSTGTGMTDADCPFLVQISISDLNIRKGAGTNYAKTGKYTGKGIFTITEVKSGTGATKGWGKLKSGAGWISLDYAVRVN